MTEAHTANLNAVIADIDATYGDRAIADLLKAVLFVGDDAARLAYLDLVDAIVTAEARTGPRAVNENRQEGPVR